MPRNRTTRTALREFLDTEIAGGAVLLAAAVVALVWANSPWATSYDDLWSAEAAGLTLHDWVNEGLMAVFFLVVGLEIKRELVHGELRDPRRAATPVIAAIGGMVVPAVAYIAITAGGDGTRGWGVPMATDIAFALGALALVGSRAPASLKLFLLALAVVDDIGAIVVIAVVYSSGVSLAWLAAATLVVLAAAGLRAAGVTRLAPYGVVAVALWIALHEAHVHATVAGVVLGLLLPEGERLEHRLHPWSSFVIVPVFALANAGVPIGAEALRDAATSRVAIGVVVGLVLGKLVGITGFAWVACRLGAGRLPEGASWRHVAGVAALAGIGFTVSLFVADLAFAAPVVADEARIGILAAGLAAGAIGALLLRTPGRRGVDAPVPR